MPTDTPTTPANTHSRRTFLTRAAIGGAVVATGAVAVPALTLLPSGAAGADDAKGLEDGEFALFAAPLELAAVQIYQSVFDAGTIAEDSDTFTLLQGVQSNHQTVASALSALVPEDAAAPVAAPGLVEQGTAAVKGAADEKALMAALGELETTMSVTHLSAIGLLADPVTARLVAQVVASEAQSGAALGLMGGGDVAELTPDRVSTKDAIAPGDLEGAPASTTTTTAAN